MSGEEHFLQHVETYLWKTQGSSIDLPASDSSATHAVFIIITEIHSFHLHSIKEKVELKLVWYTNKTCIFKHLVVRKWGGAQGGTISVFKQFYSD